MIRPMFRPRDNPFRSDRIDRVKFIPHGWAWPELQRKLEQSNLRGAIVGPEGSGKTTLLDELERRFRDQGYIPLRLTFRAGESNAGIGVLPVDRVLLVDGAEQLSERSWQRLLKASHAGRGFIITSHRSGMLPTLVECRTTPALLDEVLSQLIDAPTIAWLGKLPLELLLKHQGNLRLVLRDLYDRLAGL